MLVIFFLQAVTQLELFGDMSTPPDVTSPPVSISEKIPCLLICHFQQAYCSGTVIHMCLKNCIPY